MVDFNIETAAEVIEELKPMVIKHSAEVDYNMDKLTLNPNFDMYVNLDDKGILRIFTMRDEDKLVGYNLFILSNHPHYKDSLYATNAVVYIEPEYRHSPDTIEFFEFCENMLEEDEVEMISYSMKVDHSFDSLMKGLDFTNTEQVYTKYVG